MGNADARDHPRVTRHGRRAGEVIKESNSGAKKNRRDVDVDFVEEHGIQALLDGWRVGWLVAASPWILGALLLIYLRASWGSD